MTEAQALAIDPQAERLDWVVEYRWVPATPEGSKRHRADRTKG